MHGIYQRWHKHFNEFYFRIRFYRFEWRNSQLEILSLKLLVDLEFIEFFSSKRKQIVLSNFGNLCAHVEKENFCSNDSITQMGNFSWAIRLTTNCKASEAKQSKKNISESFGFHFNFYCQQMSPIVLGCIYRECWFWMFCKVSIFRSRTGK